MKKNELPVTYINFEDFKKLGLKGYNHRKHYYDKNGIRVSDEKAFVEVPEQVIDGITIPKHYHPAYAYSKICWEEVDLTEIVKTEIDYVSKEYQEDVDKYICLAVYKDIPAEVMDKYYESNAGKLDTMTGLPLTEAQRKEDALHQALYEYSYLDKYMTMLGAQTYLIRFGVEKLYSIRDYYETRDDYFRIPKKQTKAIYLIKFN